MGADGAVIQLVTRCESADAFVERFARFTTETDVVVPALPHVSVGTTGRFVIRLKDQSAILAGRCEVSEVLSMAVAPGAPPGSARALMRLRLIEMDAHSRGVHLRLIARRAPPVEQPSAPPIEPPSALPPRRPPVVPSLSIVRAPPAVPPPPAEPPRAAAPPAAIAPSPPPSRAAGMIVATPPSLRNAPAPTLIGVVAAVGRTAPSLAAASSPFEMETTAISPAPQPETRVPGAELTLPANPLSDLDAADLASFVELQLLETEGVDSAAIINTQTLGDGTQANRDRARVAPPPPVARSAARIEQARRIARRVWPSLACALVGLLVGLWLRSGPRAASVVAGPIVQARKVVSLSESVPLSAPPAVAPEAAREIRTGARGECVARVTTRPVGAAVFWGDLALGSSPIEHAAIPCGRATVTVRHERYSDVTRTIAAEPGRSAVVSERLYRPPAKLLVTSSPTRARIKLNKRAFGAAPRRIATLRFEHVRIEASLPGYQRWTKTLYLKEAETRVDVKLAPLPKPNARRAPAPSAPAPRGTSPSPPRVPGGAPPAR